MGEGRRQGLGGKFEEEWGIGEHKRGAHRPVGVELGQHRTVEGKLGDVVRRDFGKSARRRAVGLVVGDQHLLRGYGEAIDLAGDGPGFAAGRRDAADDRGLGAAARRKQRGKLRLGEDRQGLAGNPLALARGEGGCIAGQKGARRLCASVWGEVRQRLQQAMDQAAAQERGLARRLFRPA